MKMINFGVIGCGHIGKRHAEMISRNPRAHLAALCDLTPRETLGIDAYQVPFHHDYKQMLAAHPEIDVVCLCVPNGLHAPLAVEIMEKGFHVVIEKPMALTVADARAVVETERKTGKKAFCVMQNRYSPPSVWIKNLVKEGRLGKIEMVQLNCFWNRDARYYTRGNWHGTADLDGGTLFTQFSHFIDIMVWLFGDIQNVKGRFDSFTHRGLTAFEDSGIVSFDFVNGGMGSLNYSTAAYDANVESSLLVLGSEGSVKIGGQYMDKVEFCHIKDYVMPELPPTNPGNDYGAYKGSAQNHHYVIENVVSVLTEGAEIDCKASEGLAVVDVIEKIYTVRDAWK